jgi:hypothetical protein
MDKLEFDTRNCCHACGKYVAPSSRRKFGMVELYPGDSDILRPEEHHYKQLCGACYLDRLEESGEYGQA